MIKNVFNKSKIDTTQYVNRDSGELLSLSHPDLTSINELNQDYQIVSYEEYVYINLKALNILSDKFNFSDIGRIQKLTTMIKGTSNTLCNNNIPHTNESLRLTVDYSTNKFRDFMKRLYKEGVISFFFTCVNGEEKRFIILNPHIARKSKIIKKEILNLFTEFKE